MGGSDRAGRLRQHRPGDASPGHRPDAGDGQGGAGRRGRRPPGASAGGGQRFGAPAAYGTIEALLERDDVDLVVNTTPIPEHFAVSCAWRPASASTPRSRWPPRWMRPRRCWTRDAPGAPAGPAPPSTRCVRDPDHPAPGARGGHRVLPSPGVQASTTRRRSRNVPRDSTWYYKPGSDPIDLGIARAEVRSPASWARCAGWPASPGAPSRSARSPPALRRASRWR